MSSDEAFGYSALGGARGWPGLGMIRVRESDVRVFLYPWWVAVRGLAMVFNFLLQHGVIRIAIEF